MKKKILSVILALFCFVSVISFTAFAESDPADGETKVTVSIINGSPVLAARSIKVTDTDGDGALTVNDALYCAHDSYYSGGAKAGYASETSQYGLSLTKLWGNTNGVYGYYLNNASPQSLLDHVSNGDTVTAFVYQDTTYFSDTYSYFDKQTATVTEGNSVMLTLSYITLDPETWEPSVHFAEGATVTVNGEDAEYTVDKDGMVSVIFRDPGTYIVSAHSDMNIVPPVCVVTVEEAPKVNTTPPIGGDTAEEPQSYGWVVAICAAVICSATAVAVAVSQKNAKNGKKK